MDNVTKVILDLCGGTWSWSKPYKDNGYTVINVDIKLGIDIRTYKPPKNVYGILAAPPCPMFSFARTNAKLPRDLRSGMEIVRHCLRVVRECQYRLKSDLQKYPPLRFWALENPRGMLNWFLGHPVLVFNPFDYGDDYKKRTCLWGFFNIPKKTPIECNTVKFDRLKTRDIHPKFYGKLTRQERRGITPKGFAKAFYEANR